ncbi:cytochrome P450 [Irpex rosettiformis]|uniref:Cytochrome P450 n=1 Tax=Irpex rosettiformis TaxID=378272 RepID=A0ACB8UDP8_9APHY|nr:cytochrome P450 [Irpex rosettiformis]
MRCVVHPISAIGAIVPNFALNPGLSWQWHWRNQVYEPLGAKTISVLGWILGDPTIYTTSMEVARQIVNARGQLEKSYETTAIMAQWGPNLFSTNGDDWRRHRRILGAAFNADVYKFVWKETASLFDEMVEAEQWKKQPVVALNPVNKLTTKFALNIISRCAFGNVFSWQYESAQPEAMDFGKALEIVAQSCLFRVIIPNWMYRLPIPLLRRMDAAYKTLGSFMASVLASRKSEMSGNTTEDNQSRHDLFSFMTSASDDEGHAAMSDDEVISNTFLMLFAGHDTTAHTLDAAIGLLALYQDIQQEIYEEIKTVALEDASLPYDAYPKLHKTEACFLESLRLFPAAFLMVRTTTEDTVITTDDPHIHGGRLPLSKGTMLAVDLIGMHYNAEYFPEPEEFKPSRWYDARENDLSMFSFGSRTCIGRRFALTEAVCFLSHLLLSWRVEPIMRDGETAAQWRKRLMVADVSMTLGVKSLPIRLVARV